MHEAERRMDPCQHKPVAPRADSGIILRDLAHAREAGFGTSGVRARVTDLTPDVCRAYTQAFLAVVQPRRRHVLIGHDLRPSSPAIAAACCAAAHDLGFEAGYAGVLPTPALAFAAQSLGIPAIMVTGSHIPFDRNGLKFYRPEGEITKADEEHILAMPVRPQAECGIGQLPQPDPAALNLYIDRYCSAFAPDALAGLRIGVYEHSSAARDLLHHLLRRLGAQTISLDRSEGFVAIDTEAVRPEDREHAMVWARQHLLDAIVTTDGDADRPLVADEAGLWLRGDVLGMICAAELGAHTVVTPVTSNSGLEASRHFPHVLRTRVGSPHVIAAMAQDSDGPVVGFEANGGFLLGSQAGLARGILAPLKTRDAVLPILLVLTARRRSGRPLSSLLGDFGGRHTHSDRLTGVDVARCKSLIARSAVNPKAMAQLLSGAPVSHVALDMTDGARFTLDSGTIIHVRLSGNAPELRCYVDADTPQRAERLCRDCLDRLRPHAYGP